MYMYVGWVKQITQLGGVGLLKIVTILRQHSVCVCVGFTWLLQKDSMVRLYHWRLQEGGLEWYFGIVTMQLPKLDIGHYKDKKQIQIYTMYLDQFLNTVETWNSHPHLCHFKANIVVEPMRDQSFRATVTWLVIWGHVTTSGRNMPCDRQNDRGDTRIATQTHGTVCPVQSNITQIFRTASNMLLWGK